MTKNIYTNYLPNSVTQLRTFRKQVLTKKMTKYFSYWCSPRLLKILYSCMILLLWVCGLYICCAYVGEKEDTDDQISKLGIVTIIIPLMCSSILAFPFIIYIGGCIVALPDACKGAFPPRACCLVSPCGRGGSRGKGAST